ncbi:hypothetical protein [Hydrogenophaga sp.]|uniref:hypothetical protein n=1 Tax=Hydrogenophaga sp. TaxID=1904254 RepID=UPI0040363E5D
MPLIFGIAPEVNAQAEVQACVPIAQLQPSLSHPNWDQDTAYEISVLEEGDKLSVSIVGDLIVLDSNRFASIVRSVDKAAPNIKRLSIDAREIRVLDPIAIQSGWIVLNGTKVSFEGRGALLLTKAATKEKDGIVINAHSIDFTSANRVPLQLSVSGGREMRVNAKDVATPQGKLQGRDAINAVWRRTTNYEGVFPPVYPDGLQIEVSSKGKAEANARMRESAWPSYSAFKVSKHHAIAPFHNLSNRNLLTQISSLSPILVELHQAEALLTIEAIASLINQDLDSRGRKAAYVPSRDFLAAWNDFGGRINDSEKQLRNWAVLISQIHNSPKFDEKAFAQVEERISESSNKMAARQLALDQTFLRIAILESRLKSVNQQIAVDRTNIDKKIKELEEKDKELAKLQTVTTVVAVAVSFVGTPAAGAALAAGVSTAGGIVYQHNAGKPINVEDLATVAAKSAQVYSNVFAARKSWEQHREDLNTLDKVMRGEPVLNGDKPLTKTEAAKKAIDSAGTFAGKLKAAADHTGPLTKPDMVQQSELEKNDPILQRHLLELADTQLQIAELLNQASSLQEGIAASAAEVSDGYAIRYSIVSLKPSNDQEILRWKAASLQLWRTQLRLLYEQAADLRRSLYYETWQSPSLPKELASYPEEMTAYLAAGRYTPEAGLGTTTPANLTEAHLNVEISKHMGALRGYASALKEVWDIYSNERAGGVKPYTKSFEARSEASAPPHTKFFLQQINAQISNQVSHPNLRRTDGQLPILIPLDFGTAPEDRPERLVDIFITDVSFKNPGALVGKDISYKVQVRLAGELVKGQHCAYVDLAEAGGSNLWRLSLKDERTELSVLEQRSRLPLSFEDLRGKATAPPARSLYFMSINVDGSDQDGNWRKVPEIERLTILRRIVQ